VETAAAASALQFKTRRPAIRQTSDAPIDLKALAADLCKWFNQGPVILLTKTL